MKHRHWLILCCLALLSACSRPHLEIFPPLSNEALLTKKIPVAQLKEDVDAFIAGVLERHPAPERYTEIAAIRAQAEQLKSALTEPLTRVEFFRQVGQLSHAFNDGHTFLIWPYQEFTVLKEQGAVAFPFEVQSNPEGLFIKGDYTDGSARLAAGTQIMSINGVSAEHIIEYAQRYVGGETRILREQTVAARFAPMSWAVFGVMDAFSMEVLVNGKREVMEMERPESWQRQQTQLQEQTDFYYRKLNDSVGYLYVGHFDVEPDWFEDFIDDTFAEIKASSVTSLIIDIRDNTGGNTDTVTYLSRHIANKPFQLVSRVTEKLNHDNRGLFNYRGEVGQLLNEKWDEWETPVDESVRFTGDTYLLISPVSYSSAIVFATTLKDNGFATLIGQPTGGFANQTAQGNLFNLPHSELRVYVATKLLVRPSGDTAVQGVQPHVIIPQDQKSLASGKDTGIEAVLTLINAR
ncbi:S41 family peptidase [Aestuariibacter salexigens]|uniref:S41 family peptidase n=1 Tax=Aestuariibacter salexigens TaxID=226010 RepID=UPI00041E2F46|nr:S41 family peptidase [Aestuariibacter salexigens]